MYNMMTSFVILIWWSIISGITGRFHRNMHIDRSIGINDFDVYVFYKRNPQKDLYPKRLKFYDLGDVKFGQSLDKPYFIGRRVDCMVRSIDAHEDEVAEKSIQRYLTEGKTMTARLLAAKAVVLLEPNCGKVIWPR